MKKIMVLGAGPLQLPGIMKAKEMGLYTIAVDMDPDAVGFKYSDEQLLISTIDIPKVVNEAIRLQVDGVITLCTDLPVRTVAAVGEALNIPSISVKNAFSATDKIAMRARLKEYDVPIPIFYNVETMEEFYDAVHSIWNCGYKCIVKPADNSGSRGVILLDGNEKSYLEASYNYSKSNSRSGKVVVEEYMEGPEVCVETLSIDGKCYPIQITDKLTTGAPYFVEMGHNQPSLLPEDVQKDILQVAIACNKALGNYNGSSCTEIKVTDSGAKVVEMGARLAGDFMTTDLVPLSCGVDMLQSIIRIAIGEKPDCEKKYEKASAIRFIDAQPGIVEKITGVSEAKKVPGVIRVCIDCKPGDKVKVIQSSLDRLGYVIAQSETPKQAISICEEAKSKIQIKVKE